MKADEKRREEKRRTNMKDDAFLTQKMQVLVSQHNIASNNK
jgi:hypothetical protein